VFEPFWALSIVTTLLINCAALRYVAFMAGSRLTGPKARLG